MDAMPTDPNATTATTATDNRLMELEIKLSFMEDLLDDLNTIVVQQRDHIDRLTQAVAQLRQQQQDAGPSSSGSALQRAIENLPPHY